MTFECVGMKFQNSFQVKQIKGYVVIWEWTNTSVGQIWEYIHNLALTLNTESSC